MGHASDDGISLLRSMVAPLLEVAEYYAHGEDQYAREAVARARRRSKEKESFHENVYLDIYHLSELVEGNFDDNASLSLSSENALRNLLWTLYDLAGSPASTVDPPWSSVEVLGEEQRRIEERRRAQKDVGCDQDRGSTMEKPVLLFSPSPQQQHKLKEDLESLFSCLEGDQISAGDASNNTSEINGPASTDAAQTSVEPFAFVKDHVIEVTDAQDSANTIRTCHSVVVNFWQCGCAVAHAETKALFLLQRVEQLRQSIGSFWFAKDGEHCWRAAEIRLLDSSHALTDNSQPSGRRVRFQKQSDETLRLGAGDDELVRVSSLCSTLHTQQPRTCLVARKNDLFVEPPQQGSISEAYERRAISIATWLHSSVPYPLAQMEARKRLAIAVLLAYAYLHLNGGPWWEDQETRPDMWFFLNPDGTAFDLRRPYFSAAIRPPLEDIGKKQTYDIYQTLNNRKPSLPSFGKLLIELFLGTAVSWDRHDSSRKCIYDAMTEMSNAASDLPDQIYASAVSACINNAGDALSRDGPFQSNGLAREAFLARVVKPLQFVFEFQHGKIRKLMASETESVISIAAHESARNHLETSSLLAANFVGGDSTNISMRTERTMNFGTDPAETAFSAHETPHVCLHEDGQTQTLETVDASKAEAWKVLLNDYVYSILGDSDTREVRKEPVKVAILDTGARIAPEVLESIYDGRIREYRSWTNHRFGKEGRDLKDGHDDDGHGTHATSLLLQVARHCEVYVAQVFPSRFSRRDASTDREIVDGIANAITYAAREWKVDIITMSFGYEHKVEKINTAIANALHHCRQRGILFFAAASNHGGNGRVAWPARRNSVICVHAATGDGNPYRSTPTEELHTSNFSTLGSAVKADRPPQGNDMEPPTAYMSGTSVSTPIAAGLAAMLIDFMRMKQEWYLLQHWKHRHQKLQRDKERKKYKRDLQCLQSPEGMSTILRRISIERGNYDWLAPWLRLPLPKSPQPVVHIIDEIREALGSV